MDGCDEKATRTWLRELEWFEIGASVASEAERRVSASTVMEDGSEAGRTWCAGVHGVGWVASHFSNWQ